MTRERSVSKHHIGKVTLWREEWDVYNDGSFLSDFRGWWPVEREISLTLIRKLPGFSIGLLHVEVLNE